MFVHADTCEHFLSLDFSVFRNKASRQNRQTLPTLFLPIPTFPTQQMITLLEIDKGKRPVAITSSAFATTEVFGAGNVNVEFGGRLLVFSPCTSMSCGSSQNRSERIWKVEEEDVVCTEVSPPHNNSHTWNIHKEEPHGFDNHIFDTQKDA